MEFAAMTALTVTASQRAARQRSIALLGSAFLAVGFIGGALRAESPEDTYVAYPGERRPEAEVATLHLVEVDWLQVGEERIDRGRYESIEVLPGEHAFQWGKTFSTSFLVNPKMRAKHNFSASVTVEGGHVYSVHADRTAGQGYQTFFWIEDVATEEIVAGTKKPSRMTPEQERRAMLPSDKELARFFEAAGSGDIHVIQSMLDHGFNVEARDEQYRTALMWASSENRIDVIDLLLERGADPNARLAAPYGSTPLMIAAAMGREDSVRHLLAHPETDVNARGTEGQTALMYAAINQRLAIVKLLLEHGSELNVADSHGKTALDWAKGGKTKSLLRDSGAKKGKEL